MKNATILVIDDEKDLLELVRYNLEKEHFDVIVASDGASGLEIALRHRPDLIVLDLMMPGHGRAGGLPPPARRRSRQAASPSSCSPPRPPRPTASSAWNWARMTMSPSPFRRAAGGAHQGPAPSTTTASDPSEIIRHGDLLIDIGRHQVKLGEPIQLTATEFRILQFLATRPGRVLTRRDHRRRPRPRHRRLRPHHRRAHHRHSP